MFTLPNIALMLAAYLIGSIPFSYIIPKKLSNIDVREHGSGNTGATNVFRTAGAKSGALSLSADLLKGFVSSWIGLRIGGPELASLCGLAAVLGHCYSVFMKFRGGKGVATAAGYILAAQPIIFLILLIVQAILLIVSGYMALASMISALLYPVFLFVFGEAPTVVGCGALFALLVILRHRQNIVRLMNGTESNLKPNIDRWLARRVEQFLARRRGQK